jgi:uncharacterized protein YifE (UPF0438 family)
MVTLTRVEAQLLEKYGEAFRELEIGIRLPKTTLQKRFVRVCRGEVPATTFYEKLYLKARLVGTPTPKTMRVSSGSKKFAKPPSGSNGSGKQAQIEQRKALDLERLNKFLAKPTRVAAEWGSRDDWKRDRGSWRR